MIEQEDVILELISEGKLNEAIEEAGENVSLLLVALNYLFEKKEPKSGLIIAKKILDLDPQNVEAHKICGRIFFKLKRYSDAESEFYEGLKSKDNLKRSETRTFLAEMLIKTERFEDAQFQYKKAIKENPKNIQARKDLGDFFSKLGKYKEAELEYSKILEIDPGFIEIQFNLGDVLYELKSYEKAKEAYEKVIFHPKRIKNKKLANVYDHLGKALLKLKRYDEARKNFEEAINLNKYHAGAHNNLGILFKEQGDEEKNEIRRTELYEKALEKFEESLRIVPNYAIAHNNRGIVFRDLDRIPEAKECFERAISVKPNFVDAHTNLGVLYAEELNNYNKAIEKFEEAIRLNPSNHKAYFNLILAKSKIQKEDVDWWQTSGTKQIAEKILVLILVILILSALYSLALPVMYGSQTITETKTNMESFGNITTTTIKNNVVDFTQIIILIGTIVLLLFFPKIKKLKLAPSGVEFEIENPKEEE